MSDASDRLAASGLDIPANTTPEMRAFMERLSDEELTTLSGIQRKEKEALNGVIGCCLF